MLCDTILDSIGSTPLVKLHRVGNHLDCNIFAKCEFFNPGGSVKDRIGYQMVVDAECEGRIHPGDTLIEPTSGNTGIGIALAGAVKGYRIIITMPEKMSREKQVVLEALGAEIIRTPTEAAWDAPDSHISIAKKLQSELPNAHILDQYSNPSNPNAHYQYTAQEIIDDFGDMTIDMAVMGAGTGGTISGIAKRLKEHNPNIIIVGADPIGSILAGGTDVGSYKVEGIGYDFIPDVLDRSLITEWIKTSDRQSFLLARQLIREEGLLCGGSSGSAMYAALKAAPQLKKGQNCVVVLPDGVRNYMSKFVDDKWMADNRFSGAELLSGTIADLLIDKPSQPLITIQIDDNIDNAIKVMRQKSISQLPVLSKGKIVGVITELALLASLSSHEDMTTMSISAVMDRSVPTVRTDTPLNSVQEALLTSGRAIVINDNREPIDIVAKIDLVEWVSKVKK